MAKIYLDNASTTFLRAEVREVIIQGLREKFGNPSSLHQFGRFSRSVIEMERKKIACFLNADPSEIIFTSGGTEANNMILTAAIRYLNVKRVLTSPLEHKSVLESLSRLAGFQNILLEFVSLKVNGIIDLEDLEGKLKASSLTTLVSLMHANNEIGNILPLDRVSQICKKYKAWFHSDTVQTIGHYRLDVKKAGMHFATCSAHKIYGPVGVGFAFIQKNSICEGFILGGPQERGLRAGTQNIYGILGITKAIECALEELDRERMHIESIKSYAISSLQEAFPQVRFNGLSSNLSESLYTILSISLPVKDDLLSFYLDLKGIMVSQASACVSGSAKPSYVIQNISDDRDMQNRTSLRISFGRFNTKEDVNKLLTALIEYRQEKER